MFLMGASGLYDSISRLLKPDYYNTYYSELGLQTLFIRSEISFIVVNCIMIILSILIIIAALGILQKKRFSYYLTFFVLVFDVGNIILNLIYFAIKKNLYSGFAVVSLITMIIYVLILNHMMKNKDNFFKVQ